jgi:hypothetical protein
VTISAAICDVTVAILDTRKIERALAFHVMRTSPEPFLAPALRVCPPPLALQFLPTIGAPHTPTLAIFLIHVMRPEFYAIAPLILQLLIIYYIIILIIYL